MFTGKRFSRGGGLVALGAVLAAGCGAGGDTASEPTGRALWELREPTAYRYTITINAFTAPDGRGPVIVEVHNGEPVSVTYADTGQAADRSLFERYDTIPELFEVLDDARRGSAARVDTQYDPSYGYPVTSFIDYHQNMADDELGWEVSGFTPLP